MNVFIMFLLGLIAGADAGDAAAAPDLDQPQERPAPGQRIGQAVPRAAIKERDQKIVSVFGLRFYNVDGAECGAIRDGDDTLQPLSGRALQTMNDAAASAKKPEIRQQLFFSTPGRAPVTLGHRLMFFPSYRKAKAAIRRFAPKGPKFGTYEIYEFKLICRFAVDRRGRIIGKDEAENTDVLEETIPDDLQAPHRNKSIGSKPFSQKTSKPRFRLIKIRCPRCGGDGVVRGTRSNYDGKYRKAKCKYCGGTGRIVTRKKLKPRRVR